MRLVPDWSRGRYRLAKPITDYSQAKPMPMTISMTIFDTQLKSTRRLAIVINLDLVVGHSVEIRFLRIQCYICVCISNKVTKAISELQVGK